MKQNKNKFAEQAQEWVQLRGRVKDALLSKRTIGAAVQEIMCLLQDEIVKSKKGCAK